MTDYQKVRMACSHGPDLHFEGRVLGEFTTQNKAGTKSRWTELRLWETRGGAWIAEMCGCSSLEREGTIREARVIDIEDDLSACINEVMETFGWSTAAKAFARNMGWDVTRRVD